MQLPVHYTNDDRGSAPTRRMQQVIAVLAEHLEFPESFVKMCVQLAAPLTMKGFAADYACVVPRASMIRKRKRGEIEAFRDMEAEGRDARRRRTSQAPRAHTDPFRRWCVEALSSLNAIGHNNAVTHARLWDQVCINEEWRLDDAAARGVLTPAHAKMLGHRRPGGDRTGGVGHSMRNVLLSDAKAGRELRVRSDGAGRAGQNNYYIVEGTDVAALIEELLLVYRARGEEQKAPSGAEQDGNGLEDGEIFEYGDVEMPDLDPEEAMYWEVPAANGGSSGAGPSGLSPPPPGHGHDSDSD
jgi:hypothetical protein